MGTPETIDLVVEANGVEATPSRVGGESSSDGPLLCNLRWSACPLGFVTCKPFIDFLIT